jgi:site-specific recombinase XerD
MKWRRKTPTKLVKEHIHMTKQEILARMKTDLEVRGRSDETVRNYCMHVRLYQDYFDKPADEMGETEISGYLHYLLTEKGLSHASVNVQNSSLRFLYGVTLDRLINTRKIPRIKNIRSIPDILSKEELGYIFYLLKNSKYKALFTTIYGSGLRISEALNLKVMDIDSKNMRIFIRKGKGGRDRYALLPQKTLEILRDYCRQFHPVDWLFVDEKGEQIKVRAAQDAFKAVIEKSGIPKHITVHTLRHCFATHLLNEGKNVFHIKRLLGHVRIDTTTWYLQLADSETLNLKSPLDTMKEPWDA